MRPVFLLFALLLSLGVAHAHDTDLITEVPQTHKLTPFLSYIKPLRGMQSFRQSPLSGSRMDGTLGALCRLSSWI